MGVCKIMSMVESNRNIIAKNTKLKSSKLLWKSKDNESIHVIPRLPGLHEKPISNTLIYSVRKRKHSYPDKESTYGIYSLKRNSSRTSSKVRCKIPSEKRYKAKIMRKSSYHQQLNNGISP